MTTTTEHRSLAIQYLNLSGETLSRAERNIRHYTKLAHQYGLTVPEIATHANLTEERVRSMLVSG